MLEEDVGILFFGYYFPCNSAVTVAVGGLLAVEDCLVGEGIVEAGQPLLNSTQQRQCVHQRTHMVNYSGRTKAYRQLGKKEAQHNLCHGPQPRAVVRESQQTVARAWHGSLVAASSVSQEAERGFGDWVHSRSTQPRVWPTWNLGWTSGFETRREVGVGVGVVCVSMCVWEGERRGRGREEGGRGGGEGEGGGGGGGTDCVLMTYLCRYRITSMHLIGWQNTWEQAPGVPATPSPP